MRHVFQHLRKCLLLFAFFVAKMEVNAQRGRAIPQDWGAEPLSHGNGFGEDLFVYIMGALILVFYIIFKIQFFNAKERKTAKSNSISASNPSIDDNVNTVSHTKNKDNKTSSIVDTTQKKVSRFSSGFDEQMYYERIAFVKRFLNRGKSSKDDTWYLRRYGLTYHEYKQSLKDGQQKLGDALLKLVLKNKYVKIPNVNEEILYYYIEQTKAKVVELPKAIKKIDGEILNKFDVVIIPHEELSKYEKLLALYKGKVINDNYNGNVWVSSEMTLSAFEALYGDYELRFEEGVHYLKASDGTCAYFKPELEMFYNKTKELDESILKVREYFSMKDKEFHFCAYYHSIADENYHCHGFK